MIERLQLLPSGFSNYSPWGWGGGAVVSEPAVYLASCTPPGGANMAVGAPCKLFVKHLPSLLNYEDKEDLLKHFGAREVICMGRRGKMVSGIV